MIYKTDIFAGSKTVFESLKEQCVSNCYVIGSPQMEVRQSSIFPYERKWLACDVATREEIHIPSDEWVNGVMFSRPAEIQFETKLMELMTPTVNEHRLEMLMFRKALFF